MNQSRFARSRHAATIAMVALAAVAVAGCSGSTTPSAVASAVAQISFPPVGTEAPTEAPPASSSTSSEAPEASLATAVPTAIDPCQLITADEAGTLVGVTFGAGKESTTDNNLKVCTYAGPGPNIFTVEVGVAPDEATAQAAEAQAKADLNAKASQEGGPVLNVVPLPSFADNTDAAILEGSATKPIALDARAFLMLRGVVFALFSDIAVGGPAPSQDAMKAEANTVLSRLP